MDVDDAGGHEAAARVDDAYGRPGPAVEASPTAATRPSVTTTTPFSILLAGAGRRPCRRRWPCSRAAGRDRSRGRDRDWPRRPARSPAARSARSRGRRLRVRAVVAGGGAGRQAPAPRGRRRGTARLAPRRRSIFIGTLPARHRLRRLSELGRIQDEAVRRPQGQRSPAASGPRADRAIVRTARAQIAGQPSAVISSGTTVL